ncbi:hypothetical protein RHSIM_Rhsim09G0010100 [Rhododendron simsii]|uniref:Uncharacterized protein n=1 Tax=Rhododendron simsii TaxID=118357 RepID=A0A834LFE0_RHOSS|nr:hypothetical protein RHSIM_Rhsim09G0010100 [Rhododendron simsii]
MSHPFGQFCGPILFWLWTRHSVDLFASEAPASKRPPELGKLLPKLGGNLSKLGKLPLKLGGNLSKIGKLLLKLGGNLSKLGKLLSKLSSNLPGLGRNLSRLGEEPHLSTRGGRVKETSRTRQAPPQARRQPPRLGSNHSKLGKLLLKLSGNLSKIGKLLPKLGGNLSKLDSNLPGLGRNLSKLGEDPHRSTRGRRVKGEFQPPTGGV